MSPFPQTPVLAEEILPAIGVGRLLKNLALVLAGIVILALAAKIRVPIWPSPVPVTMGSFAVLTLGAAYGPRLGLLTILGYLAIGALGFDVFANSDAGLGGVAYMTGATGGYLLGFVLATVAMGLAARRGWDRSLSRTAVAMALGTALIYLPGILWLGHLYGWEKPILAWGLTPFLIGDAMKLALAAMLLPTLRRLVR